MLRGCAFSLVLYGVLAAAYYYWFSQQFDAPGTYIGAGVVALLTMFCIGALFNARTAVRDLSLISSALHGLPPADGRVVAACGRIEPIGEPVQAPFSGRNCVLCEYDLASKGRPSGEENAENKAAKDFTGFLMNPCVIRGTSGDIRLLGFPDLVGFSEANLYDYLSAGRAREFLATTEFEDKSGMKFLGVLSALAEVWCDDDGLVRKNMRLTKADPRSLFAADLDESIAKYGTSDADEDEDDDAEDWEDDEEDLGDETSDLSGSAPLPAMSEKRVNVGEQVCAIGVYQSQNRGLVPPKGSGKLNKLIRGDAETICRGMRKSVYQNIVGGFVVLALIHAVAWGVIQLNRYSPEEARKRQNDAFQAAQDGDVVKLDKLLRQGVDVKARDSNGRTLLLAAREPKVAAFLIKQGVEIDALGEDGTTALMMAARQGKAELVAQLIAAGANLNLRSPRYNTTALMEADSNDHLEVAELLRKAGAEDDVVTAKNGRPLPEDGGAVVAACMAYIDAIHAADPAKLATLISKENRATFEDVDWNSWHNVRLVQINRIVGFEQADRASVRLSGITGADFGTEWDYQLVREDGEWKVLREDWKPYTTPMGN